MINFIKNRTKFNNLNFDQVKNFMLEFSDCDKLDGVIFKKIKTII